MIKAEVNKAKTNIKVEGTPLQIITELQMLVHMTITHMCEKSSDLELKKDLLKRLFIAGIEEVL